MKYVVAVIGFFFVWFVSAFIIGLIITLIVKPAAPVVVGIGFDLVNLPGTIVGLLAGLHSARATIRRANAKAKNKEEKAKGISSAA